jgi:hypothetical protein
MGAKGDLWVKIKRFELLETQDDDQWTEWAKKKIAKPGFAAWIRRGDKNIEKHIKESKLLKSKSLIKALPKGWDLTAKLNQDPIAWRGADSISHTKT